MNTTTASLILLFCTLAAHAQSDDSSGYLSSPSQVSLANIENALRSELMPGTSIKKFSSPEDGTIEFSVIDPTSTKENVTIDHFKCDMRTTSAGRDILIPACTGNRTINGKNDSKHSNPTLADISKRGSNSIVLKHLMAIDNKYDKGELNKRLKTLGMTPDEITNENARNCIMDDACSKYMSKHFGHRNTQPPANSTSETDGQKD